MIFVVKNILALAQLNIEDARAWTVTRWTEASSG
jgi:hypothetical protein